MSSGQREDSRQESRLKAGEVACTHLSSRTVSSGQREDSRQESRLKAGEVACTHLELRKEETFPDSVQIVLEVGLVGIVLNPCCFTIALMGIIVLDI